MSSEVLVIENKEMALNELNKIGDFSSVIVSSKDIAEQTGKTYTNVNRDIKHIFINMAGGEEYVKGIVTGGLGYVQYRNRNASSLFDIMMEKVENGDLSILRDEYFQHVTWKKDSRGFIKDFCMRGDVALHIVSKYDDNMRWNMISYMKAIIKENRDLVIGNITDFINPKLTREERFDIYFELTLELAKRHKEKNFGTRMNTDSDPKQVIDKKEPKRITNKKGQRKGHRLGGKTGMRYLDIFNMNEDQTFTVEEASEQLCMDDDHLTTLLVDFDLLRHGSYLSGINKPENYSVRNNWMIDMSDDTLITTKGIQHIYRRIIKLAKQYGDTHNVTRNDMEEMNNNVIDFYKRHDVIVSF